MSDETIEKALREEREAADALTKAKERRREAERKAHADRREALKPLVVRAHDALCGWNHTDGCGWNYEVRDGIHAWESTSHTRWLDKYEKLVYGAPYDDNPRDRRSVEFITMVLDWLDHAPRAHRGEMMWFLRIGGLTP